MRQKKTLENGYIMYTIYGPTETFEIHSPSGKITRFDLKETAWAFYLKKKEGK